MADFAVNNLGTIVVFTPLTERAYKWLDFNCPSEPWQWFNGGLAVEPRCAPDILDGLTSEDFTVE